MSQFRIGSGLSRIVVLWILFAVALLMLVAGLGVISRHALQLSREQAASQQSETTEKNTRIALWRLDSRVGPMLAMLHEPGASRSENEAFVKTRFKVLPSKNGSRTETVFVYETDYDRSELEQAIPIERLVDLVKDVLPGELDWTADALLLAARNASGQVDIEQGYRVQNIQQLPAFSFDQDQVGSLSADARLTHRPIWIDDELVLVHQYAPSGTLEFQGVWIDWIRLKNSLLDDIPDLMNADLRPIVDDGVDPAMTLATLPAELVPIPTMVIPEKWSPTQTALAIAWLALIAASLIAAIALHRIIALSERRAMFVSAVTHELRTPLTTFRLYSDMLARDMIGDPETRKQYLQTLGREADRLTHLVDNVLRYSKLERGSERCVIQPVILSEWIARIAPRMEERLRAVDLDLIVEQSGDGEWMTDPAAMEQLIFNLVDNAAKYATPTADRRVHLKCVMTDRHVEIAVIDHGSGVPSEWRSTIFKPFTKSAERGAAETAAGIGLGLALARQTAAAMGGQLDYASADDGGATFKALMPRSAP